MDAPKELVTSCNGTEFYAYQAYRQRIGGKGTPNYEVLAYDPRFDHGIHTEFVSQWEVDYYNDRARDIHGKLIESTYKEGDFTGGAIVPDE